MSYSLFPTDKEFLENRYSAWSDHFAFKDTGEVCGIKIRSNHALFAPDVLTLEFGRAPPGCRERMQHVCQAPPPLPEVPNRERSSIEGNSVPRPRELRSLEDRTAALEKKVNDLTEENAKLKDRVPYEGR